MPSSYFPLRWESTGDQWWYASPIDWAAANGHYDLVRELLHIDNNLLIKLTSLRRIRRLETVWDDDARFVDAARCRAYVARNLLLECETKNGKNTLIRAGYGGWLLYTAASAGDMDFVRDLLNRDPLMVFGEGEYGVTDIFYAAARSRNPGVFRVLFDYAISPRCLRGVAGSAGADDPIAVFKCEMVNRAVHAAARGGNLEMLKELLRGRSDVLVYRDANGSTVLHAASGRGQVEVVKDLLTSYDIVHSKDNQGNTALHVAAFRGHLPVVEALIVASPSSVYLTNNLGDGFLHTAAAGFRSPGFRRLDRQMELVRRLVVCGSLVNVEKLINMRNNDGRTVLHLAVIGNVHSDLVELLMTIRTIDLNIRDVDGMTALDLLGQRPRTASSDVLIRQLISAGGISNSKDHHMSSRSSAIVSRLRLLQGFGSSPGTTFRISDAEIFLYTGGVGGASDPGDKGSGRPSSCSSTSKSDLAQFDETSDHGNHDSAAAAAEGKKLGSVKHAARHLNFFLLKWARKKERKKDIESKKTEDSDSMDSFKKCVEREDTPTPLRQRFSKPASLQNNKRTLSVRSSIMPSPSTKKKFAAGLMHGVIQAMPHLNRTTRSPSSSSPLVGSSMSSSPTSDKQKGICPEIETGEPSGSNSSIHGGSADGASQKSGFVNTKLMNQYFCFGAQGLTVEDSASTQQRSTRLFKRSVPSAA